MVKKFYSRMALTIINKCNQRCSWCFEGRWKDKPTEMMSVNDIKKLLKWKDWSTGRVPVIILLGGEPTLHPQLLEIVDTITDYNSKIAKVLLTNLTCDEELIKELLDRKVELVVNVDQFEKDNNIHNQSKIIANLDFLNQVPIDGFKYNITATVSDTNKDFTFLYEILKKGKDRIYNLRIAPSSVGFEFKNKFQKEYNADYYGKVLEVVTKCKEISSELIFSSECAINGCMISEDLVKDLKNQGYHLKYSCGDIEPNADILPNMSSHWCFAFQGVPEMTISNVFDYTDYDSMVEALKQQHENFKSTYAPKCDIQNCKNQFCNGTCPALTYYHNKF